ncbi:MAG: hypothetical protein HY931_00755 [Candidatus Falkowbacteria bacterium]|nr:MAG: hypothetical protein HY931_00755 [Candidatus Falkowbacteria bacterium]
MIDLNEKRQAIIAVATEMFNKFVSMPPELRSDDKPRTGIKVLVWEPGTRNLILFSVAEPSEAAQFFVVEKAVRSHILSDMSSQNSEHEPSLQYMGSLSVFLDELEGRADKKGILLASTSGLKGEEDAAISASVLAEAADASFQDICDNVASNFGKLPFWYDSEDKSYFDFLF